jgi:hypothetical protein
MDSERKFGKLYKNKTTILRAFLKDLIMKGDLIISNI